MIGKDRIKELLSYNAETGAFTWNVSRGKAKKGSIAGHKNSVGYIEIGIDGSLYYAHRLAFLYTFGKCSMNIDHIDGDKSNNAIKNLRLADPKTNSRNSSRSKSNKSGITGVSFDAVNSKWRATIKVNGKQIHLGRFATTDEAKKARLEAQKFYGFHDNHGKHHE